MEVISIKPFGDFSNCYIIKDETGTAAVVDPGCVTDELISELDKCTKVEYILLTHGHYDHIWAVSGLKEKTGAKLVIHRGDEAFLTDENLSHGVKYFPASKSLSRRISYFKAARPCPSVTAKSGNAHPRPH